MSYEGLRVNPKKRPHDLMEGELEYSLPIVIDMDRAR